MRRRTFIAGLGSAAAWPVVARAQQGDRVRRIGVLMPYDETDPDGKTFVAAFTKALADLGAGRRCVACLALQSGAWVPWPACGPPRGRPAGNGGATAQFGR